MSAELFSEEKCAQIRQTMLNRGIVYAIPAHKLAHAETLGYSPVAIELHNQKFVGDTMTVAGSISAESLGLTAQMLTRFRDLAAHTESLAETIRTTKPFYSIIAGLATREQQTRMEYNRGFHDKPLFPDGSIIRMDIVFTGNPEKPLRVCDSNVVPLGYAWARGGYEAVGELDGTPISTDRYINTLAGQALSKANGILTDLTYPNWPSHTWVSRQVSEASGNILK